MPRSLSALPPALLALSSPPATPEATVPETDPPIADDGTRGPP
ncbi:MAG: hypothetical protein R3F14_43340 [Polyangiaceae bacterium]